MKHLKIALAGLLGLSAFVAGTPLEHADGSAKIWWDNKAFTYRCRGLAITRCDVSDGCEIIEECRTECVDYNSPPDGGVPGAGCSDAAEVSKRDDSIAPPSYNNHDGNFYTCTTNNDIQECNESLVATCTIKNHCPLGCFQKPDGAMCVDRATPTPPTQVIARDDPSASLAWDNYDRFYYICDVAAGNINKCSRKLGSRRCIVQERCQPRYCAMNDNGAWCRKKLGTEVSKRDEPDAVVGYDNIGYWYYICDKDNVIEKCSRFWGIIRCYYEEGCGSRQCYENDKGAWCLDNLATTTEVSKRDDESPATVAYDNGKHWSYVCQEDNTVHRCHRLTGECTVREYCPQGCFQKINGAACIYRLTLPSTEVSKRDDSNPAPAYDNEHLYLYTCNDSNGIEGCFRRTGHCVLVDQCPRGCFKRPNGANCIDRITSPSPRKVPVAADDHGVISAPNDCGSTKKPCKMCTSDKRAVFTCQYGFCYVEPKKGHCSKDTSCHDSCACCKKGKAFGKKDVELVARWDGCAPGEYKCERLESGWRTGWNTGWILVCDAQGNWKQSSYCGTTQTGYGCCKYRSGPGWIMPNCDCRSLPGGPPSLAQDVEDAKPNEVLPAANLTSNSVDKRQTQSCSKPGEYICDLDTDHIDVCNAQGNWQFSSWCCGKNSCVNGPIPGTAHCLCQSEKKAATNVSTAPVAREEACVPGYYKCSNGVADWVGTCNAQGIWQASAYCGVTSAGVGCCREVSPSIAFCDCRGLPGAPPTLNATSTAALPTTTSKPASFTKRQDVLEATASPVTKRQDQPRIPCLPGWHVCNSRKDSIDVCNAQGVWVTAAMCCGPDTCRHGPSDSWTAYCVCKANAEEKKVPAIDNSPAIVQALPSVNAELVQRDEPVRHCNNPGAFMCTMGLKSDILEYCNAENKMTLFSVCCGIGTCVVGPQPGAAYCNCKPKREHTPVPETDTSAPPTQTAAHAQEHSLLERDEPVRYCNNPGAYMCTMGLTTDLLEYCNAEGKMTFLAKCCGVGTCVVGPQPGSAYCDCK